MNERDPFLKSQFRAAIRARRTARVTASGTGLDPAQAAIDEHVSKLVVAHNPCAVVGYASLPGEPSLDTALEHLIEAKTPVLLPVTKKGEPLLLGHVTGPLDDLPRGTWGIREPESPLPAPEALAGFPEPGTFLVLVPGLAYDAQGVRLGNGGGFYDRTFGPLGLLADDPHTELRARLLFVGICWDEERSAALPHKEWDLTVDAVLTEAGLRAVSSDT